jgi:hypothetical protein
MKLDVLREIQQQITVRGTGQPSAKALSPCTAMVQDVSVLSSSVEHTVVMFYNSAKKNEWFEKC